MKEKRRGKDFIEVKESFTSARKKSKKKHKKKHNSSTESHSSDDNIQWVEAPPLSISSKFKKQKKKKHKRKYDSSKESHLSDDYMQWVEASSHNTNTELKKKKKKKKYTSSSSSSESSSDSEESRAESPPISSVSEKRDSWMNEESFVPTLSKDEMYISSRQKRMDSIKEKREKEEKIHRERELNPHLKNEGSGLPEKETNVDSLSLPSTSVGDGGYSWLKKAYYRIQEQAQNEGRSMEEVAVERWGSLSKLTSLIEEAEERMKSLPHFKQSRNQYNYKYDLDNRHSRSRFKKPSTDESEKSFESPFQYKKPANDTKNQKMLNQFRSSKKSNYMNYSELDEKTKSGNYDNSKHLFKEKILITDQQTVKENSKYHEHVNHIPSWKKPNYLVEKVKEVELSAGSQTPLSSSLDESSLKKNSSQDDSIPIIYSDDDLNKLSAEQLKAEIMGDSVLAEKLKNQLTEARKIVKEKGFAKQSSKKVEEVILSKIDRHGQARPIQTTQGMIEGYKQKKSNTFFDDGSRYSLKQMFEREKLSTADDHMEMFVEAAACSNDIAELDYESGHISKKICKKLSATREEERDIGRAIQQHQKHTSSLERCRYCLDQPNMKKYLIVDVGEQVYLCLPDFQTLTVGHCLIVPKEHVSSFLALDENVWKEVNDFKNQLRNFFRSDNKSVIFLETSMNFRYFPHAVIECIPYEVPEEGDMAPFYFKKAIEESETEWAHNKKLIDLRKKGLRYSIPKNLPYFHVEFDPSVHAGYAHVIEDEKKFPKNFGKEVIGGMLDIDYNCLYKNKKDDRLKKCTDVATFEELWKKFKNV